MIGERVIDLGKTMSYILLHSQCLYAGHPREDALYMYTGDRRSREDMNKTQRCRGITFPEECRGFLDLFSYSCGGN